MSNAVGSNIVSIIIPVKSGEKVYLDTDIIRRGFADGARIVVCRENETIAPRLVKRRVRPELEIEEDE